jgi:hypothetical protein
MFRKVHDIHTKKEFEQTTSVILIHLTHLVIINYTDD